MAINYEPIGWDTTKYVNPTNMNHMDEGIRAACNGVDAANESLANYLPIDGTADAIGLTDLPGDGLYVRAHTGTLPSNVKGKMCMQANFDTGAILFGVDGIGNNALAVNKAICDKNGNAIHTTYALNSDLAYMDGSISCGYGYDGYVYKCNGVVQGYMFVYSDNPFPSGTHIATLSFKPNGTVRFSCNSSSERAGALNQASEVFIDNKGRLFVKDLAKETIRDFVVSFCFGAK